MIEAVCVCGRKIDVIDEHAGLSIKCPKCRRLVAVPADARPSGDAGGTEPGPNPQRQPASPPQPEPEPLAGLHWPGREPPGRGEDFSFRGGPPRDDAALLRAIEGLTATCHGIQRWLVAIFVVLILLLLRSVLGR